MSMLLSVLFVSAASADTCETVTTCEVVGTYEQCRYNRRGELVCTIYADEECTTELQCTEDDNLGGGDCYYAVTDADFRACLGL